MGGAVVAVGGSGVLDGSMGEVVFVAVGTMGKVGLGVTPAGSVALGVSVACAWVAVGGEHSSAALSRFC